MKKSKKELVNIKDFMECWLHTPYEERGESFKMRQQREKWEKQKAIIDEKEKNGIPLTAAEVICKKKLAKQEWKRKKRKHVLTHKGMRGFLVSKGYPLPKKTTFEEAEHQNYAGEKIIYVQDETKGHTVIPYRVPHPLDSQRLLQEVKQDALIQRRSVLLLSEYYKACSLNDQEYARMLLETLRENRMEYCLVKGKDLSILRSISEDDDWVVEKPNRREVQQKIYSYGRKFK